MHQLKVQFCPLAVALQQHCTCICFAICFHYPTELLLSVGLARGLWTSLYLVGMGGLSCVSLPDIMVFFALYSNNFSESLGLRSKILQKIKELRIKTVSVSIAVPDEFLCPITRELMKDPVIAAGMTLSNVE